MVFMAKMEKILFDLVESSASNKETLAKVSYYSSDSESESDLDETLDFYDKSETNYVLKERNDDLLALTKRLEEQLKVKHVVINTHTECQAQYAKLEEEKQQYVIKFSSLVDNDRKHRQKIDAQEILYNKMSLQVKELESENEGLKLLVEELTKARECVEVTLRQRDEMISAHCQKLQLFEELFETFSEIQSEFDSDIFYDTQDNSEKDLILSLQTQLKETAKLVILKHDTSLENMIETIEKEYESKVSKISIPSSTFETKNLELEKEIGDIDKRFDEEKKVFETNISKLEKVLAQRVKDFDDVKTELLRKTDK
ncbi:hypothetical protein Tco_0853075 [Tanacetum coccineum]